MLAPSTLIFISHFTRERIESQDISIIHKSSEHMLADILTKALSKTIFERLRDALDIA
ncbi:hypothetical protein LIPSTDRAFT_260551 [Lipomyces starkeyi NRRL Y-11557]|uniref:Uncharacterized protein n=1 Tax=Lipomyces starkeyi NRRL Y-11557 TaxID=675824 RepID=A0A1E3Q7D8_LIPST|nr:hypothetical protein LIPSTDRAFT_260551 [Lipomyces starkeyi NRRL Y-11557]